MTASTERVRVAFGGDREVCAALIDTVRADGGEIVALGLNTPPRQGADAVKAVAGVDDSMIFYGRSFSSSVALRKLERARPHLGVCCGFAPILPAALLNLPEWGWVNIHRSYLPYNRGLDPLQWALIDRTPAGVTIHVMTENVDAGAIIAQQEMPLLVTDTYDSLETRSDDLVLELFKRTWPRLRDGDLTGTAQDDDLATYHTWEDCKALRRLDLSATMKVGSVLDILRGYSSESFSLVELQAGLAAVPFRVHLRVVPMIEHPS